MAGKTKSKPLIFMKKKHKCIKFMQSFKIISDFSIFTDHLKYYVPTLSSCMKILKICPTETQ